MRVELAIFTSPMANVEVLTDFICLFCGPQTSCAAPSTALATARVETMTKSVPFGLLMNGRTATRSRSMPSKASRGTAAAKARRTGSPTFSENVQMKYAPNSRSAP
ncbi:hypothetical protein D3C73_1406320 [compost metagenome]